METSQSTSTVSEEYHKAELEEFCRLCQLPVTLACPWKKNVWFHSLKSSYESVSNRLKTRRMFTLKACVTKCRVRCLITGRKCMQEKVL